MRDGNRLVYVAVVFAVAGVLVIGMVGAALIGKQAGRDGGRAAIDVERRSLVAGCERTQVQRAFLRVSTKSPQARALFRIVDCAATYARNVAPSRTTAVFLAPHLDACFVILLREGYWQAHSPVTDPNQLRLLCN